MSITITSADVQVGQSIRVSTGSAPYEILHEGRVVYVKRLKGGTVTVLLRESDGWERFQHLSSRDSITVMHAAPNR